MFDSFLCVKGKNLLMYKSVHFHAKALVVKDTTHKCSLNVLMLTAPVKVDMNVIFRGVLSCFTYVHVA